MPNFPNPAVETLAGRLTDAIGRKEDAIVAGHDTAAIDDEILDLRRWLRDGGQLPAGDILGGRFRLIDKLGRGGFATVWKA